MPLSDQEDISQELANITAAEEAKQKKASVAGPSAAGPIAAQRASGREGGSKKYVDN
jgi:hypothetical protein